MKASQTSGVWQGRIPTPASKGVICALATCVLLRRDASACRKQTHHRCVRLGRWTPVRRISYTLQRDGWNVLYEQDRLEMRGVNTSYQVTVTNIVARPTAVVKAQTTRQEFPTLWRELLDEVWACLHAGGITRGCRNIMLYWDDVPHALCQRDPQVAQRGGKIDKLDIIRLLGLL